MDELIRKELKLLIGRKIIVHFKYSTIAYNIRKSGVVLECGDDFFVLDEMQDGRSIYSYDFVIDVKEERA